MTYTCPRCLIRFEVAKGRSDVAYTRCAEPRCDLRFWHGKDGNLATVGVDPLDRPGKLPCIPSQRHHGKADGRALSRQFNEAVRDAVEKSSVVHDLNVASAASGGD